MATTVGFGGSPSGSWIHLNNLSKKKSNKCSRVRCASSTISDPYKTLSIHPGSSESEVRKAFRQLALKFHPDVCRGSNCGVQFHQINEAYDIVMSNLRGETKESQTVYKEEYNPDEAFRGMNDPDWDMWEEWMGWEGAGIRDYTSHINPYI